MKIAYTAIVLVLLLLVIILLFDKFNTTKWIPPQIDGCELFEIDRNKDGEIDSWIYRNEEGITSVGILDHSFDGKPDSWAYFKDGKAFFDEEDFDRNGEVDGLYLHILSEDKSKVREFSFELVDVARNIFVPREDTGWVAITHW